MAQSKNPIPFNLEVNYELFQSKAYHNTGCLFFWTPPKKLEYKIPFYPLALREISEQLTWDLVL